MNLKSFPTEFSLSPARHASTVALWLLDATFAAMSALAGRTVTLVFRVRGTSLYALQFVPR